MIRLLCITIILLASATNLFAQSSATANISAIIITPVGTKKSTDLNFGNFISDTQPGTIELHSTGTRTSTGGIKLLGINEAADIASFVVNDNNSVYSVTLVSNSGILIRKGGKETMKVGLFRISNPAIDYLNANSQTFGIGATLNTGASQVSGDYVPAIPFTVIVNYN